MHLKLMTIAIFMTLPFISEVGAACSQNQRRLTLPIKMEGQIIAGMKFGVDGDICDMMSNPIKCTNVYTGNADNKMMIMKNSDEDGLIYLTSCACRNQTLAIFADTGNGGSARNVDHITIIKGSNGEPVMALQDRNEKTIISYNIRNCTRTIGENSSPGVYAEHGCTTANPVNCANPDYSLCTTSSSRQH